MTYSYNPKAHYAPYGKHQELINGEDLTQLKIVVKDDNKNSESFSIKVPDSIFDLGVYKYLKDGDPFVTAEGYHTARSSYNFQHNPMKLWEVQLNFAVHCATSGLGVSTEHLNAKQPLVKALYRFHAYYHVRRILKRMLTPLPGTEGFDKYNNAFNLEQVRRIGDEYGVTTKSLGIYENKYYFDRTGKYGNYFYEHNDWTRWIMNSSHGFTKYGLEKISESIRAYSYLMLTSQASARHGILGDTAQSLAAQRIFYDNLEDVINKVVSLEDDIGRYQNTLKYARSTLDYSVGRGLYMLPSDLLLKPLNQVIEGYNDKIVINTSGFELGKQHDRKAEPSQHEVQQAKPGVKYSLKQTKRRPHTLDDHQDEVTSVIWALGRLMLFGFWFLKWINEFVTY